MRKFLFLSAILLGAFLAVSTTGFYPAALVDGGMVSYRNWRKTEEVSKRFANAELARQGIRPIDFSSPEYVKILVEGRRETLTALIEDKIIVREGASVVSNFAKASEARVEEAVRRGRNLEGAVKTLYGISLAEFRTIVLLPQARREVLARELGLRGSDFETWLKEVKKDKSVRLMFVPFRWNGERIE